VSSEQRSEPRRAAKAAGKARIERARPNIAAASRDEAAWFDERSWRSHRQRIGFRYGDLKRYPARRITTDFHETGKPAVRPVLRGFVFRVAGGQVRQRMQEITARYRS
jgi:hypothetical protein